MLPKFVEAKIGNGALEERLITPNLAEYERKEFSQFGEDGVIERVAAELGIESGMFFEFEISPWDSVTFADGLEGNFVAFRKKGWRGVFLDGMRMPPEMGVECEFVTAMNVNQLYRKHRIPIDLDFMSVDVDGQEFWIWLALEARPKVIISEFNGGLGPEISATTQFNTTSMWDGTVYHGASYQAMVKLGHSKGYTLVWCNGVNLMFVRDDLIANKTDFDSEKLFVGYVPHKPDHLGRTWVEI